MLVVQGLAKTDGVLVPAGADKDLRHRMTKFAGWLGETGCRWYDPDLAAYRDYLIENNLALTSIAAHLSTIRGQYRRIARTNATRQALFDVAPPGSSVADRKAFTDEVLTRMINRIDDDRARVKLVTSQDKADDQHLRLSKTQADTLMRAPGVNSVKALRDTAILALMLCTGIREGELAALEVCDLRQTLGGELALHVRKGKGAKERLVPYGELSWVLVIVEEWLSFAGILEGPVFWSLYRGTGRKRSPITTRGIQLVVGSYGLVINGQVRKVKPHDLRRTYARRLYEAGVDLVAIQQNLGHAAIKTTLVYIGTLDASARCSPAIYEFNLNRLNRQEFAI